MNKHDRDQFYKRIILNAIDHEYMEECGYETLVDACNAERPRYHKDETLQYRVSEWLQGLPSACTIPFYNHEILDMAHKTGLIDDNSTECKKEKILNDYFKVMAAKVIQLSNGYHVPSIEGESDNV